MLCLLICSYCQDYCQTCCLNKTVFDYVVTCVELEYFIRLSLYCANHYVAQCSFFGEFLSLLYKSNFTTLPKGMSVVCLVPFGLFPHDKYGLSSRCDLY